MFFGEGQFRGDKNWNRYTKTKISLTGLINFIIFYLKIRVSML